MTAGGMVRCHRCGWTAVLSDSSPEERLGLILAHCCGHAPEALLSSNTAYAHAVSGSQRQATETVTPAARAPVVDRFAVLLDDRLADLRWSYEQKWEHLPSSTRDWLRGVLNEMLDDTRADVLALVCALPTQPEPR